MDNISQATWNSVAWVMLLAAIVCYGALALMLRHRWPGQAIDRPNQRSLHTIPTPRMGGLGIACSLLVCAFVMTALGHYPRTPVLTAIIGYASLTLLSLIDDIYTLPALPRLLGHLFVAALTSWAIGINLLWLPLATLLLAWSANLFNFMDGADGLAGGMALIGFSAFALAAGLNSHFDLALLCAAISAASVAFLRFNLPPARLFMGDCGSIPLGFSAGFIGLYGAIAAIWPPWFGVILFFPFCFDASLTLLWRAWRRQPLGKAHREHLYQRAVLSGLSHWGLLHRAYALMLASAVLAGISYSASSTVAAFIIMFQFLIGLMLFRRIGRLHSP